MIPLQNAELLVYGPSYIGRQATVPQEDIISVNLTERVGRRKDDGDIVINNDDGQYDEVIKSGHTLEFKAGFAGNHLRPWGDGEWGDGRWGFMRTIWLARVRDRNFSYEGEMICDLEFDCEDYAFSVLADRNITREYKNTPVNRIMKEVVQMASNRIQLYVDPSLNKKIEIKFDGESAFDALEELMDEVDAEARSWRQYLTIKDRFSRAPKFQMAPDSFKIEEVLETDEQLANYVKLHGGQAVSEGTQKVTDTYYFQPVQPGDPRSFQIYTEKYRVAQIDLRLSVTREPRDSPINVRIQKDDGGRPLDVNDETKDIVSKRMGYEELMRHYRGEEGRELWLTFEFNDHTLPEPDPWVIIEVEGDAAQRFVFDAEMTPSHVPYFPYRIIATDHDLDSATEFGRREVRINAEHVTSNEEAEQLANRKLRKYNNLDKVVQGQAQTWAAHNLRPGEVVTMHFDREHVSGSYMVTERHALFDGVSLDTNLSLEKNHD